MSRDSHKLSLYHRVVRVIAGIMVFASAYGIVLILLAGRTGTDPIIRMTVLSVFLLMLILSILMFRSPSRDP